MEYLLILEGKNGIRFEYRLNPEPLEKKEIIQGLTTPEELESTLRQSATKAPADRQNDTLRRPCVNLAARLNGLNQRT
jgi:hypothetical protein